jgi:copper oxidase (laccase) domain-containing protein
MTTTTTTSTSRRSCAEPHLLRPVAEVVWRRSTSAGEVIVHQSTRRDGDFHRDRVAPVDLERRRRRVLDAPWTMLDEVHGTRVVVVDAPGAADGAVGDALVTGEPHAVLGVWTGDCAPVVMVAPDGRFGAAHAGWKGLAGGVLDALAVAVESGGAGGVRAYLGPVIGPCCYEFGRRELAAVARGLGVEDPAITGRTRWGAPSLDVPSAVTLALGRRAIPVDRHPACTRCDRRYFSHRRGDPQRHVTAAWRTPAPGP